MNARDPRERAAFRKALLRWYRHAARDLPWRRTTDRYRIWLSEVLLQQTHVETVLPYYQRFLDALPTVQALAAAPLDRVLKLWEGLGYYARARHLLDAARVVVRERGGRFPECAEQWRQLPGVGRYTAAAISSIVFGEPAAVLDGNVKRVLARLFRITTPVADARTERQLWSLAGTLLSPTSPGAFNQAMMELGARICRPRRPACPACPVRAWCAARKAGVQDTLPVRRAKRPVPQVEEVAAVICKRGRYLLVQRPRTGLLGGLWELPGGAVEPEQAPVPALTARLREMFGIDVSVGTPLPAVTHAFTHRKLRVRAYVCSHVSGRPRPSQHTRAKWIPRGGLHAYALTRVTHQILARVPE